MISIISIKTIFSREKVFYGCFATCFRIFNIFFVKPHINYKFVTINPKTLTMKQFDFIKLFVLLILIFPVFRNNHVYNYKMAILKFMAIFVACIYLLGVRLSIRYLEPPTPLPINFVHDHFFFIFKYHIYFVLLKG